MDGAKSIQALSVVFMAGVAAGTMVPAGAPWAVYTLLLTLLSLPFFLHRRLRRLPEKSVLPLIFISFLLLGVLCGMTPAPLPGPGNALQRLALRSAERLRALIGRVPFPHPGTAPLLQALLTGDRSGLPQAIVKAFRDSGASHLLALSGLHMGILYLLFDKLTVPLGSSPPARRCRSVLMMAAAGWFTLMTGAGPSVTRAFLYIAIGETLRLSGRPRDPVRVLSLALLVQLTIHPQAIRSVGFQLSYLAMAGIVFLYPTLRAWYPEGRHRLNPLRSIWQTAALSISCQVFTAPLVWLRWGNFPPYFLLTNLLAVPLVTILMGIGVTTLLLYALGCCPALLITITDGLGRLCVWVLEVISGL